MTDRPLQANTEFVFDDEPLESILYDDPGGGPSSARLFASAENFVSVILQAFERGEADEGLQGMAELFTRGDPVSTSNLIRFAVLIGSFIPHVPRPIVKDRGVPFGALLECLFAAGLEADEDMLVQRSGTLLYRYFEGCGRYADAARVVGTLLERAKGRGNRSDEAVLTNNLGYEHLLSGEWEHAESCFARAIALFADDHAGIERLNARLNHLLARCGRSCGAPPERFERKLFRFQAALGKDWRRRKALIPLARIAERRGDLETAIRLARRAVEASEGIPTLHALDDKECLERLEAVKASSVGEPFAVSKK
jgi:tetratricopeptide (TPR) repeat protein